MSAEFDVSNHNLGLVLRLLDYEAAPTYPIDCLEFVAAASTEYFQGQTTFSVYKRDLEALLDDLDAMASTCTGQASIRCGWGKDIYFGLDAYFIGSLGHIAIDLELARNGQSDRMLRMQIDFGTEPLLLDRFASKLRHVSESGDRAPVRLTASQPT